jgi:hypothetical protein
VTRDSGRLACLLFLLASVPLIFAQSPQPAPEPPLQLLGPQLIAWSELQKPQPLMEQGQYASQAAQENRGAMPPTGTAPETRTAKPQNFTGTIEPRESAIPQRPASTKGEK